MLNKSFFCTLLLILAAAAAATAEEWGPWSNSASAPVVRLRYELAGAVSSPAVREENFVRAPFFSLLNIYKKYISPLDGDRCPMYPTCSQYSAQAIHRHGLLMGIVLTSDRLLHEADERKFVPAVKVGSRYRIIDSLEDNDFWWNQK